jgi:hypothetical protein
MPKSSPGRNAADGKNHRFLKGNYREKRRSVAGNTRLFSSGLQRVHQLMASKCKNPPNPKGVERALAISVHP